MSLNATTSVEPLVSESRGLIVFGGTEKQANGGLDGAARMDRETLLWNAPDLAADVVVNKAKKTADARTRDQVNNNGYMSGGVEIYKDSVVGSEYRLMAEPNYKALGLDEVWANEFKEAAEIKWRLYAESQECWADASRRMSATEIIRLNIGVFCATGEYLVASEWLDKDRTRPYKTAFNTIDVARLSNPRATMDTRYLRRGVVINDFQEEIGYWIRTAYENSPYREDAAAQWKYIAARKPWGRKMMFHCADIRRPEQTRAVSRMVSVLKEMRMTEKFQDIVLQNAITNATYAAAIESELPRDIVYAQLGEMGSSPSGSPIGAGPLIDYITSFLAAANEFQGGSKNLALDGVKIPHLLPGTKLNLMPAGNPGGVGTNFESSFLRHVARGLGISYEEFSGNFAETNYSGARAAMATTERSMRTVKRIAADRLASEMYSNLLEEEINRKNTDLPLPRDARNNFYTGMNKAAYTQCRWIGSARAQLDEGKETQAAGMRIGLGISTVQDEASKLGKDWREVALQRKREWDFNAELGLPQPGTNTQRKDSFQGNNNDQGNGNAKPKK